MVTYGFPHPICITKENRDLVKSLTDEQLQAVCQRDMILSSNLGVMFDQYMSLIGC